jgi:FKBP-type peptidyl-prolyl cis-trans isomerase SlpA
MSDHQRDDALAIGPGTRVTLHFAILLTSGEEVDSTFSRKPATFEVGDGNLPAGFEEALHGLRAGESASLEVPPEKAFGMPNPDNMQTVDRASFAPDMALEPGLVVSFADAAGAEVPGVVAEYDEDTVTVDFNHPLAGRPLRFDVNVIRVEPAAPH